jgi:hypothetical protein
MESFSQEHVVGIPSSSLRYADEKTQIKPTCPTLVRNKDNDPTIFFPVSLYPPTVMCMLILISILSLAGADKKNSIIYRISKLSQKTDSYMQGFKEHSKYDI